MKAYPIRLIPWLNRSVPYATAEAFSSLFERTHLMVFRYICVLQRGTIQDAEDITAETFLRAWRARNRFQGDEQAAIGWLFKIAHRLIIDNYRRRQARPQHADLDEWTVADAIPLESTLIQDEQQRVLWSLINQLPDEQREMLVLRYMFGWRVKQIAAHMEISDNTISVTLRRTLGKLQEKWVKEEQNHDRA